MNPIHSVISIYKENSIDFNYEIEFHLLNGIVFSDDKTFMFAIPCDSDNPEVPVPIDNANCIFIALRFNEPAPNKSNRDLNEWI